MTGVNLNSFFFFFFLSFQECFKGLRGNCARILLFQELIREQLQTTCVVLGPKFTK